MKVKRNCAGDGFENSKVRKDGSREMWSVDRYGVMLPFCPAKATWYPNIMQLFIECKAAYYTGYLPKPGDFWDQDQTFCEVYHVFVERFEDRKYARVWDKVNKIIPDVLKALGEIVTAPFRKR